ncbi:MAG: SagB/ThcOx family dehydrogenase [Promethearchaeota archaeon]
MENNSLKKETYGDNFQQKTKYIRGNLPHHLNWSNKPDTYKKYDNAIFRIKLPKPEITSGIDFWRTILNRHSSRSFTNNPITINQFSSLLFGMCGLTRRYRKFAFRTTPSAGGLYPIEVYPVVNNMEVLKKGVYHYDIKNHQLECIKEGNYQNQIFNACLGQKMVFDSSVNFIWTAIIERSRWKYLQRCYRYIYLDCGHIGQNFYLVAEALGLGACTIGAVFDDELNEILDIDGLEETAIYVGVVGNI